MVLFMLWAAPVKLPASTPREKIRMLWIVSIHSPFNRVLYFVQAGTVRVQSPMIAARIRMVGRSISHSAALAEPYAKLRYALTFWNQATLPPLVERALQTAATTLRRGARRSAILPGGTRPTCESWHRGISGKNRVRRSADPASRAQEIHGPRYQRAIAATLMRSAVHQSPFPHEQQPPSLQQRSP